MKKGFLLSGKKAPRAKIGSVNDVEKSPGEREGVDRPHPTTKNSSRLNTSTTRSNPHPPHTSTRKIGTPHAAKGGMKRGFLLKDSSNTKIENHSKKLEHHLPQCKLGETPHTHVQNAPSVQHIQSKKRIPTTSTALLEFEHDQESACGQKSKPVVSSLLRLINDDPDDTKGRNPPGYANDGVLGDRRNDSPSLDSWINQPSSSSQPSLVLHSTGGSTLPEPQRKPLPAKSGKPLIVEIDDPPVVQEVVKSSIHIADSTTNIPGHSRVEPSLVESSHGVESTNPNIISDFDAELKSGIAAGTTEPSPKDSLRFANDVSLFLAQLRHSMKSKRRNNCKTPKIDSLIGVGMFMSNRSTTQIKSFVTIHLSKKAAVEPVGYLPQLDILWKMVLEPIAEDYTEILHSRKKKNMKLKTIVSPPLGLGLGVVEFLPAGFAYESLTKLFLNAAHANHPSKSTHKDTIGGENTKEVDSGKGIQYKQLKISALGAVYMIRCRIRCIGVTMTNLEVGIDQCDASCSDGAGDTGAVIKDIQLEVGYLLSVTLPALEGIVSSDASGGPTVLMSSAADACFELIETSSRVIVLQHMLQIGNAKSNKSDEDFNLSTAKSIHTWRDILPLIERLLAVKRRWASRSNNTEGTNDYPSRVKCAFAVLDDWLDVIRTSKRYFFDRFVGEDWRNEGADITGGLNFFWNLSGFSLKRAGKADSSERYCFRVGGIAQSLCQRQESTFGSPCGSPLHDLGGSVEAEDLVSLIEQSATLTDSIRIARKASQLSEAWTKSNQQRAAMRSFASWLSRGKKAMRILTKSVKSSDDDIGFLDSAMGSLIALLRSESKQCVDMSVSTLSILWSESPRWMPEELRSDENAHPRSFLNLLDVLQMHSSQYRSNENGKQSPDGESIVDPTSRALCAVVARVALQRPTLLVPSILKMKGREEIRVEVLLNMLEELPNSLPPQHDSENDNPNNIIYHAASKMIVENIESVSYLRWRLHSNPTLFSNVPCEIFIPQILEHLVKRYAEKKSPDDVSPLSGLVCIIMKANANIDHADAFIRCVLSSLHQIEHKDSNQSPSTTENKSTGVYFFNKNVPLWRLALLQESSLSDSAYKEVLLATAKSMVEMPSSSTPLALLAALVDNQFHTKSTDSKGQIENRISIATSSILHFATHHISISRQNDMINEQTIFNRLSPLLLLRRIPRSYYRVVHKALPFEKATRDIMVDLATFLSGTLTAHARKNDQSNLAKEEKKLIAELTGHCLPFSNKVAYGQCCSTGRKQSSVSLFENICREPFADTLRALRGDQEKSESIVHSICESKAALYAVSHCLPLAFDEDDGEALLNVASFVFEVLKYQPDLMIEMATDRSELFQKEMMMLQSGASIHFLAVCMDSMSCRESKTTRSTKPSPLIEDLDSLGTLKESKATNACTILTALSKIFHMLKSVIATAEICWGEVYHKFYSFPHCCIEERQNAIRFPPSSRTSMLNSIVMLSQASRSEDRRLDWLASNIIPTLVDWAREGPADDDIRHPLCIAAALQVIYTLLARRGSFAWLASHPKMGLGQPSETDFACRILQCALKLFHSGVEDEPTVHILRLAALKVMLTVIALNQANESGSPGLKGYLNPKEIQQAMSALHGAANVDQNPEVRRLANQIIPYLI